MEDRREFERRLRKAGGQEVRIAMKTRLIRFAALLLAGLSLASAQTGNWSPLQQEVINHLHDRMNASAR